jgi:hypothetical protein
MRFPTAWADIASQNVTLKGVIAALSVSLITVATVAAKLGLKDPLVIERGCVSQTAKVVLAKTTDDEVKAFLKEVLPMRFTTSVQPRAAYFAPAQLKARTSEQDDLGKKGMRQTVIVNSITIRGDSVRVDTDRIIAVDKIRSAFPFPLDVSLSKTSRAEDNPYGLVLTKITPAGEKDGGK